MRKILKLASLVVLTMLAAAFVAEKSAMATQQSTAALTVAQVNASRSPTNVNNHLSSIELTGLSTFLTCLAWNGRVILRVGDADKNMMSVVLAAFLSGKKVTVLVDDAVKDAGGFCFAQMVSIQ